MELPTEFKGTIYFYQHTQFNFIYVTDGVRTNDPEYILLGTHDVDIKFDVSQEQATKQVVDNLKEEKKRVQAETQKTLNGIDDQINSLLAITHEVES